MSIYIEKFIDVPDPRLKRHVKHDSRSLLYAHDTSGLSIAPVEHAYHGPFLDQGQIGKCTAECALNLFKSGPYYSELAKANYVKTFGSFDDLGTDKYYNLEENLDGDGPYPPNDEGSTGLTMAKIARNAGLIPGWTQVFNFVDFLKALTQYPIGCGTYWFKSMFEPDSVGRLKIDTTSGKAGGHEYVCLGYDGTKWLKFVQSWGDWAANGFFYADAEEWSTKCLQNNGDATIFTPPTSPAPVPANPFTIASAVLDPWAAQSHVGLNATAARTWRTYAKAVRG